MVACYLYCSLPVLPTGEGIKQEKKMQKPLNSFKCYIEGTTAKHRSDNSAITESFPDTSVIDLFLYNLKSK